LGLGQFKLAVFGNSVSAVPVKEDKTVVPYPDLLQQRLTPSGGEVLPCILDGGTVLDLERIAGDIIPTSRPRAVILQTGIVDCALRPLSPRERQWLSELRPSLLRALVIRFIHQFRTEIIRIRGPIQFMPLPEYLASFKRLIDTCSRFDCQMGILPIFPVTERIERRSPSLTQEIEKYNRGMQGCDARPHYFQVSDFFGHRRIDEFMVTPDSVHFNQLGHQLIAERLFQWLPPISHSLPI
jgi:lysophospholipase L1-like esterase